MIIIKKDASMSNANKECKSLARTNKENKKKKRKGQHIHVRHPDKKNNNISNKKWNETK